jgi:hypothetical protein
VFIGFGICAYLFVGAWLNKVHHVERKMNAQWAQLKQSCDRRTQLLPEFVQLIQSYAPQAQDLIRDLNQSYLISSKNHPSWDTFTTAQNLNAFTKQQINVRSALINLQAKSALYPALVQNRQFLMLKMEWEGLDQQIDAGVKKLNQYIGDFNTLIDGFWHEAINGIFLQERPKEVIHLAQQEASH